MEQQEPAVTHRQTPTVELAARAAAGAANAARGRERQTPPWAGAANAARGHERQEPPGGASGKRRSRSGERRPGGRSVAAVTVVSLMLQLTIVLPASSHDWYTGFTNPRSGEPCCNVDDCKPVASDAVRSMPQGWMVVETGEVVPYREALRSEDRDFHLCRKGSWKEQRFLGPLICLFAPPMAF